MDLSTLITIGSIIILITAYKAWKQNLKIKHPEKFEVESGDNSKIFSSNKDFDSTIFLLGILVGFLGLIAASIFIPEYAKSGAAVEVLDIFKFAFGAMVMYFFKQKGEVVPSQNQNGNGAK